MVRYGHQSNACRRFVRVALYSIASHGRGSTSIILQRLTVICTCALSVLRSTARPLDALPHDGGLAGHGDVGGVGGVVGSVGGVGGAVEGLMETR